MAVGVMDPRGWVLVAAVARSAACVPAYIVYGDPRYGCSVEDSFRAFLGGVPSILLGE